MWLYSSPVTTALAALITWGLLLWLGGGRSPLAVAQEALQTRSPWYALAAVGIFGLLGLNWLETRLEPWIAQAFPWDFTGAVSGFGASWVRGLQRLESPSVTHLMTFAYTILFTVLPLVSMTLYTALRDLEAMKRLLLTFIATYLIGLPFFLCFPVREAWTAGVGIRFLIPEVYPAFEQHFRPFSALDNSFPSFHTALALTVALVAWRSGHRRLGTVLGICAVLVMVSTLYLGVHSVLDLVAGAGLSVGVVGLLAPRRRLSPHQGEAQSLASALSGRSK